MTKQELRKHIRQLKTEYLKRGSGSEASEPEPLPRPTANSQQPTANSPLPSSRTVLLYYPLPDEADVRPLLRQWSGKRILLPVVVGEDLELREYQGEASLRVGAFHILEPTGPVFTDFAAIDLAIIPGVAFTRDGRRLGRGRGYYDRLLPRLTNAYKIGVCWPFQLVDDIPVEPHDILMDEVVTIDFIRR